MVNPDLITSDPPGALYLRKWLRMIKGVHNGQQKEHCRPLEIMRISKLYAYLILYNYTLTLFFFSYTIWLRQLR